MNDVMIDLETLGTQPGCVIVSIGACRFGGGEIGESFYERIDMESGVGHGLVIDPGTVKWWLGQEKGAQAEVSKGGESLPDVLGWFSFWLGARRIDGPSKDVRVWGNGATFDLGILAAAYSSIKYPLPWVHWNERCYRTAIEGAPENKRTGAVAGVKREGTHHNALDDAITQARRLMAWRKMQVRNTPAEAREK